MSDTEATSPIRRWVWRLTTLVLLLAWPVIFVTHRFPSLYSAATGAADTAANPAACLPGTPVPIMKSPRIASSDHKSRHYTSVPATSGPHVPFTIASGVYSRPIDDDVAVSVLANGRIVVRYATDIGSTEISELVGLTKQHSADIVLSPDPRLRHKIALTAWGRIEFLNRYDGSRATAFVRQLDGRYDQGWTRADSC